MANLTVRQTPLAELRENPANPRRIRPDRLEQLKQALAADPDMLRARPLVALPDGTVICGNMRLRAARELGWQKIPAVVADLDPERITLWTLRDNQEYGEWDDGQVGDILAGLAAQDVDLTLTGFADADLRRLLNQAARRPADPDDAPEPPAKPRSKPGEVYELGPHRLVCGDARDAAVVAEATGGGAGRGAVDGPAVRGGLRREDEARADARE